MGDWIVTFINNLIKGLGTVLNFLLGWLPPSPFHLLDVSPIAPYLPYINYFIPLSEMVSVAELWLTAIGVYYIYHAVLNWIKIDD